MKKRSQTLQLECLEDRTTPTTLTVSFVPDGTLIGTQHSQLFNDLNSTGPTATWQQGIFGMLQNAASPYNLTLKVVADDGASLNAAAPQDGQLRIAAVDQAFATGGPAFTLPNGGNLVVESQVTFGVGLGLIGPNGGPATPPINMAPVQPAPGTPPSATLPFILPLPTAFGNLYPTATTPDATSHPPVH